MYKSIFEENDFKQGSFRRFQSYPIHQQSFYVPGFSSCLEHYITLKLQGPFLFFVTQQNNEVQTDIENAKIQLISHNIYGQGIKLIKNQVTFDFYGKVDIWYDLLAEYCIQYDFTNKFIANKLVGVGNFAKVYKARYKKDQKDYAVKAFDKYLLIDSKDRASLLKEISILRQMTHTSIINLIGVYESKQFVFLVHQYLDGGELHHYIAQNKKIEEDKAARFIAKILDSIAYIHSKGIIHRDLKPQNIVLKEKNNLETAYITDFGLADYYRRDGQYMFTRCGTPGYVAPEVLQDKPYDFKVDVFSIGIILYILVSGYTPFPGILIEDIISLNYKGKIDFNVLTVSPECLELLKGMLSPTPALRLSIQQARLHPWFRRTIFLKKNFTLINKQSFVQFSSRSLKKSQQLPSLDGDSKRTYLSKKINKTEGDEPQRTKKSNFSQFEYLV